MGEGKGKGMGEGRDAYLTRLVENEHEEQTHPSSPNPTAILPISSLKEQNVGLDNIIQATSYKILAV